MWKSHVRRQLIVLTGVSNIYLYGTAIAYNALKHNVIIHDIVYG